MSIVLFHMCVAFIPLNWRVLQDKEGEAGKGKKAQSAREIMASCESAGVAEAARLNAAAVAAVMAYLPNIRCPLFFVLYPKYSPQESYTPAGGELFRKSVLRRELYRRAGLVWTGRA